ncbi:DUF2339 domain-containing protein [bacterium]|nr:MAG: DUF2339 domain-containing protein [bacterium]
MTFILVIILAAYIVSLSKRVKRLEQSLPAELTLTKTGAAPASPAAAASPAPAPASMPSSLPERSAPTVSSPLTKAPASPEYHAEPRDFVNLLPKIGVVALLFGLGFFLKYSIDQGWVSINLRLLIGALVGLFMLILYYYWKDKYAKYALTLAGGGIGIWYLTMFAAVQMYGVISPVTGLVILVIICLAVLILSRSVKSQLLEIFGWVGAYLSPLILGLDENSYYLTLTYLTVVSVAIFVNSTKERNHAPIAVAIVGSLFNLVFLEHRELVGLNKGLPVIIYLAAHFITGLFFTAVALRESAQGITETVKKEFTLLFLLLSLIFGIPLSYLVYNNYPDYASLILLSMGVWSFICYAVVDRVEVKGVNYALAGVGAAFMSLAAIWEFGPYGQVLAIYILGLVGLVVGRIQNRAEIRIYGLLEIILGLVLAASISYESASALFISNKFGIELLGIVTLILAYFSFTRDNISEFENDVHRGIQYIASAALMFFVSYDLLNFYDLPTQVNERNLALSIWWLILAVGMFALSVMKTFRTLRKPSLVLFGIVILKVFLYDLQTLDTVYRIISFITLGVILLVVSFMYQKNKEKIKHYLES